MKKAESGFKRRWRKRYIAGMALMMVLFILLSKGCSRWLAGYGIIPGNESSRQFREYEEKAEEIMTEYLAINFPDARITWCDCWTVYGDAGGEIKLYLTDYVRGTFEIEEDSYAYYVNVNTGEVYTDYYQKEIVDRVYPQICEKLGIENYIKTYGSVGKRVCATKNEELDSYELDETLLIPIWGDVHEDELDEFVADIFAGNGYEVNFTITYDDDIRIEDMDFNELAEEMKGVQFFLNHRRKGTDLNRGTDLGNLEEMYFVADCQYRYFSYNITEQDDIFLVYEEYSSIGGRDVQINTDDIIRPDNFTIKRDDEKIEIRLREPTKYYLCFSDTSFLGAEGLYCYRDASKRYLKTDLIEDWGLGSYAVYARGLGPYYYDKSESFYIGMPSTEENSPQAQP